MIDEARFRSLRAPDLWQYVHELESSEPAAITRSSVKPLLDRIAEFDFDEHGVHIIHWALKLEMPEAVQVAVDYLCRRHDAPGLQLAVSSMLCKFSVPLSESQIERIRRAQTSLPADVWNLELEAVERLKR